MEINRKKFILAVPAAFIAMFILGGVWHNILISETLTSIFQAVSRSQAKMPFIAAGYVLLSFLMSYMYAKSFRKGVPWKDGLKFGMLVGLLWILPIHFVYVGTMRIDSCVLLVKLWHVVEQGIGGLVIGLVYGKGKSSDR